MIDPKYIRKEPEAVRKNFTQRNNPALLEQLDRWLENDRESRKVKTQIDSLRADQKKLNPEVVRLKKEGKDASALLEEGKRLGAEITASEARFAELDAESRQSLMRFPNLLDPTVPVGKDGTENPVVRSWGTPTRHDFEVRHHGQLATALGIADFERAVKISGEGFYALKGDLALLNLALINYAVSLLEARGFTFVVPPAMMRREPYEGVTDLGDFGEMLYKVEGIDAQMIATAEHPLTAMYMNEILPADRLPICEVGYSMNFRKEIGAHGLDERGLFRLHQFDKVEQIVICKPEESQQWLEKLVHNAEALVQGLGIPYQVVAICTGDIGTVAAKKYDIECWSTREQKYFETHSCSNCTTYQALRLGIRHKNAEGTNEPVHTLNATVVAIPRMLRAIIENFQTARGTVMIPEVLRPFCGGKAEIVARP